MGLPYCIESVEKRGCVNVVGCEYKQKTGPPHLNLHAARITYPLCGFTQILLINTCSNRKLIEFNWGAKGARVTGNDRHIGPTYTVWQRQLMTCESILARR